MQTNIRTWGNSQGLCIPKDMLRQLGWTNREDVEIIVSGEQIIIEKVRQQEKPLAERVAEGKGFAAQYADPEMIEKERNAFREAMVKKYESRKDTD